MPAMPRLVPHPDFPIEWWFCQGRFRGPGVPETTFMAAFFRLSGKRLSDTGPMLLLSVLRAGETTHSCHSRVGPELIKAFASRKDLYKRAGADPTLLDVFLDEVWRYGPPTPIVLDAAPVDAASDRLDASWRDFVFVQNGRDFTLGFASPDRRGALDLKLTPKARWLNDPDLRLLGEAAYVSCPRLALEGTLGGTPITGEAWIDQQWCRAGFYVPDASTKRLLGTDWLGINLDDGSDLIVLQNRDMRTRRKLSPAAVLFEPGVEPRVIRAVRLTPSKPWTSPDTRIDYPLHWRIDLPEDDIALTFTPDRVGQEIPVFGFDAIWEGSGTVTGTRGGRRVSGRARLELDGYGHLLDAQKFFRQLRARVTRHIARKLPRKLPAAGLNPLIGKAKWAHASDFYEPTIAGPAWHLLDEGGKQWRSVFALTMLEALGVPPGKFEYESAVLAELIHTATLIVDDIEDASPGRRGVASTHVAYGLDVALNAGNALYFLPLQVLANHPDLTAAQRDEMYRLTIDYFVRAHFGQAHDIFLSTDGARRRLATDLKRDMRPEIMEMYASKTSAQIMALAEMGCIVAETTPEVRARVVDFARTLGVAFQILDDIHGLKPPPGSRKTAGEDIILGKLTYLNHAALMALPAPQLKRLAAILANREARKRPALREAIALIEQSGAIPACRAEATAMVIRDWRRLSALISPSRGKTMLRTMWTELLAR